MDWLKEITTEDLYKLRDVLDDLEGMLIKHSDDGGEFDLSNLGLCYLLCLEKLYPVLELFNDFWRWQASDYFEEYGVPFDAYFFQDWHTRGIAAGFISCWIDDELISRGE